MTCQVQNIIIVRGDTYEQVVRWETRPFVSKQITGITKVAQPVITTSGTHGLTDGWRVAVVGVQGMTEINASATDLRKLKDSDFNAATVLSSTTVGLYDVNASEYSTYSSGGYLVWYSPVSLAGYTARMQIKETVDSEDAIVTLTSSDGITIDDTDKTISILIAATATDDLVPDQAVYDLEMVSAGGVVKKILRGTVTIQDEVTT